jgi:hypothetical protein
MGNGGGRIQQWIKAVRRGLQTVRHVVARILGFESAVDLHTRVTFRAVTDAVLPETPELGEELGSEHVPGGIAIDLDEFVVTYIDDGFQLGLPHVGPRGNIPLADPIADVLDAAARTLVARDENVAEPDSNRPVSLLNADDASPTEIKDAAGEFATLSRNDRLRAISILDEFEIEVSPVADELFEFDAGLVGQLVIGFTEMIYYSEWQGYDEFVQPPSERVHPNDPSAVQSWRQTGFPGFANGYAALRGYVGTEGSSLGHGETWTTIDSDATPPVQLTYESGSFRENDYDTSGYEEPYPEGA